MLWSFEKRKGRRLIDPVQENGGNSFTGDYSKKYNDIRSADMLKQKAILSTHGQYGIGISNYSMTP